LQSTVGRARLQGTPLIELARILLCFSLLQVVKAREQSGCQTVVRNGGVAQLVVYVFDLIVKGRMTELRQHDLEDLYSFWAKVGTLFIEHFDHEGKGANDPPWRCLTEKGDKVGHGFFSFA
jgi:hypothetical protein